MMIRDSRWCSVLAAFGWLSACAGATPTTSSSVRPVRAAPSATDPETSEQVESPPRNEDDAAASANPEPASDPLDAGSDACVARAPALPIPVCPDARLDALLAEFATADRDFSGVVHCEPLSAADLDNVPAAKGRLGDASAAPGFFGDLDVDGNGKPDMVRTFTSVDYWGWLLFVRDKNCFRFVAEVSGYQVELAASKHHGVRDVRVFTYPLQGKIEVRHFDGKEYVP